MSFTESMPPGETIGKPLVFGKKLSGVEFAQKGFEWKEKTTFFPRNCMQPIVHSVEIKTCILARLKKGWTLNGQFKLGVNYCLYQNLFIICVIYKLLTVKKRIKRSSLIPRSFKAHSRLNLYKEKGNIQIKS